MVAVLFWVETSARTRGPEGDHQVRELREVLRKSEGDFPFSLSPACPPRGNNLLHVSCLAW